MVKPTDSDPDKWEYPPHTKAKHQILKYYLGGWFPKLSLGGHQRILFIDGFAGRGRYNNGEIGSPIIALETLLDHVAWDQMKSNEFVFYFIEKDEDNVANLEAVIEDFKNSRAPWPPRVRTCVLDASFEETAEEIARRLAEQKARLAPTFAFVDPFGFKGMKMDTVARLLDHPACEVFVNFMVMYVNRFLEHEYMGSNMNELFGLDVPSILAGHSGGKRVQYLHDVYAQQLREVGGFTYVQSFAMKNEYGNIEYYLFHGTRHEEGVGLMKDAMWKIDPDGNFTFDDRAVDGALFEIGPSIGQLKADMLEHFRTRKGVSTAEIYRWGLLETLFRRAHVTTALRQLDKEDFIIKVNRPHSRAQFSEGVTVDYP